MASDPLFSSPELAATLKEIQQEHFDEMTRKREQREAAMNRPRRSVQRKPEPPAYVAPHAKNTAEEAKSDNHDAANESKKKPEESWPVMDDAAYHGLAGDFANAIDPHTEADKAGILLTFLVSFGNAVGHSPYYVVEGNRHYANMYASIVGESSKSRKGTGAGRVRSVLELADPTWTADRNVSGLSSGEGLIAQVRNPVEGWSADKQCKEIIDPGVQDKRLMVTEAEFAGTLAVMERSGNSLSRYIRDAWDSLPLQTLVKNFPLKATNTHISLLSQITRYELRSRLTRTDMANGFANRFLFGLVKRSKLLPFGGHFSKTDLDKFGRRTKDALDHSKTITQVTMTDAAAALWNESYRSLSSDRPGLLGAVTARAEAQVIRLSLIYALIDKRDKIDSVHLLAAMAVWAYCDNSALIIFGDSLGDPVADDILRSLRRSPDGMTRTDISNLFGRNRPAGQIGAALAMLLREGLAKVEEKETNGRPAEVWFAVTTEGPKP